MALLGEADPRMDTEDADARGLHRAGRAVSASTLDGPGKNHQKRCAIEPLHASRV